MGNKTSIEWCDATWNPIRGCTRVSEECVNCYAERIAARFSGPGKPYAGLTVIGKPRWNGQVRLVEAHLEDPFRWQPRRRIFVNSMSDLFHEKVSYRWIDKVFAVMALCPEHIFMVLTKRPERAAAYLDAERSGCILSIRDEASFLMEAPVRLHKWPLDNVWMGVSVGNQKRADERRESFRHVEAAVKFVSYEPALGPMDWRRWEFIDQIIAGGESGPGARPAHPDWFRSTRDWCQANGKAFFFKQHGEFLHDSQCGLTMGEHLGLEIRARVHRLADGSLCYRVGKHDAGRLLDGREWNEFPNAVQSQ